jgi:ABC-type protease/lipase transport system fused ATPase/permease subunit
MPSDTLVIYSMNKVGKVVPPNKQILRDISLGFYYGAKIGVLGLNGAGIGRKTQGGDGTWIETKMSGHVSRHFLIKC